jgi:hypothetical protein
MNSIITVSANIGAMTSTGIKGWFNKRYKNKCIAKINNQIDNITEHLTDEELADFIKCEISVRGDQVLQDGVLVGYDDNSPMEYKINFVSCNLVFFYYTDYDNHRVLAITYRDGDLILSTSSSSKILRYNDDTMKQFDFDPISIISKIARVEMKLLCKSLVYQRGV